MVEVDGSATASGQVEHHHILCGVMLQQLQAYRVAAGTYTVTVSDANSCTSTSSVTITEPAILVASASKLRM